VSRQAGAFTIALLMKGSLLDNIPIRGPMKEQQPGKKADITSVIKVSRIILQS